MTISEMMLPEFDHEAANTRALLECVPEEKFAWKPHEKSMTMGRLASHIAEMANWAVHTINDESLELTPDMKPFIAGNKKELMDSFASYTAAARAALAGASDEHLSKNWSLIFGGKPVLTMPRSAVLRNMVFSHIIHHRGQLTVYLRLNDIAIPGMYGPSADAKM
jgi:uncharacterized damage-inducible protein DinB